MAVLLAAVANPASAQLGGITEPLGGVVDDALDRVGGIVEPIENSLGERVDDAAQTVDSALDEIDRIATAAAEIFLSDEDASGREIERDIWVVLVPEQFANQIPGWGFTIRARENLEGLDLVMLRVEAPGDRGMTETEQALSEDAPGTVVDFNHAYGPTQVGNAESIAGRAESSAPAGSNETVPPNAVVLGLIDSAIASNHEAFEHATIIQQDFVPFKGERRREHGTAVASIALEALRPRARERPLALLAASVFFATDGSDQIATTGSLVSALEWLGNEDVSVINMSLTGPPNRVLEAALAATAGRGTLVIAAVGNDGPAAGPLYPAAYDSVIGITAVDDDWHIYRRANRGPQVAFSALGVRVRAARLDGGFRRETGTSMAAPIAAAVIATELASRGESADALVRRLERHATDLGAAGYDEVYGHGLLAPEE